LPSALKKSVLQFFSIVNDSKIIPGIPEIILEGNETALNFALPIKRGIKKKFFTYSKDAAKGLRFITLSSSESVSGESLHWFKFFESLEATATLIFMIKTR
jgi:hypothetical protein